MEGYNSMKTAEIINQACSHLGVTKADLAKKTGLFPSSLYRKLANESMTFEELQKSLAVLGVSIEVELQYQDGDSLSSQTNHEQMMNKLELIEMQLEAANKVAEFHKKTIKELRTELNSAVGYVELGKRHPAKVIEYLDNLEKVHASMEKTIAYSLGDALEEEPIEAGAADIEALAEKRVLLVEDNRLNREILKEVLLDYGLLVEEVDNGNKAIALMQEKSPGYYQFILMDIEMPEQNGYETTIKIRKLPNRIRANTPIIALTANANAKDREKAFASGMDDFLMKPINTNRLLGCLTKFM